MGHSSRKKNEDEATAPGPAGAARRRHPAGTASPDRPAGENTINAALRRLGFEKHEMTGHGFRSAASSTLNESGLWHADAIERQLAHVDGDSIRGAFARAEFWKERVRMMA